MENLMTYNEPDPVTKRVLPRAEYTRNYVAKLAQIARIKQLTAYMNCFAERGD
ncbi:hypothetical protein ENT52713_29650 [Enterobacter sp. 200527-13]|nr:hypothetical protein ENT52713_29650 [Enterobacter sp. 200527-13]